MFNNEYCAVYWSKNFENGYDLTRVRVSEFGVLLCLRRSVAMWPWHVLAGVLDSAAWLDVDPDSSSIHHAFRHTLTPLLPVLGRLCLYSLADFF